MTDSNKLPLQPLYSGKTRKVPYVRMTSLYTLFIFYFNYLKIYLNLSDRISEVKAVFCEVCRQFCSYWGQVFIVTQIYKQIVFCNITYQSGSPFITCSHWITKIINFDIPVIIVGNIPVIDNKKLWRNTKKCVH